MKIIKILGAIVFLGLIICVILAGLAYWYFTDKYSNIQQVEINEHELGITEEIEQNLETFRNIVIFGVDGDAGLEEGNRSDSIILITLNEKTNEVKMTSIYRDTYVKVEGYGLTKINHAYSYGSAELALKTMNTNFDLNVTEFVTVNFDVVEDVVDYIGGITVEITSEEVSHISGINTPGTYTLTGKQALEYSRIRYATGGDFVRTERMRTVLEAVVGKVSTYNLFEINDFMDYVLPKVYTNVTSNDILEMVPLLTSFNITESIGFPYDTRGITLDLYYGVPVTLQSNVTKLHEKLFGNLEYQPSSVVEQISNDIISKTGYSE